MSTYGIQIIVLFAFFTVLVKQLYTWSYDSIWKRLSFIRRSTHPPSWLLTLFAITPKTLAKPHRLLFTQAGFTFSYSYFIVAYRLVTTSLVIVLATLIVLYLLRQAPLMLSYSTIILALLVIVLCEPIWLKTWIRYRKKQIIFDIYQLSSHLLYFSDSQMNIYYKLKKSIPYTTTIRRDLEVLLMEWTQDTDFALQRLKERLACHEATSFIDTVGALRQHQDESFYELLRERITEYKEQLEIANDSKKETTSYILFVLAGIPILYTFQIFIYPWVKEVQELLLRLN